MNSADERVAEEFYWLPVGSFIDKNRGSDETMDSYFCGNLCGRYRGLQ